MTERNGWQTVAKRIRVPMGFVFAAIFLWLAKPHLEDASGEHLRPCSPGLDCADMRRVM